MANSSGGRALGTCPLVIGATDRFRPAAVVLIGATDQSGMFVAVPGASSVVLIGATDQSDQLPRISIGGTDQAARRRPRLSHPVAARGYRTPPPL